MVIIILHAAPAVCSVHVCVCVCIYLLTWLQLWYHKCLHIFKVIEL